MSTTYQYIIEVRGDGIKELVADIRGLGDASVKTAKPISAIAPAADDAAKALVKTRNAGNDLVKTMRGGVVTIDATAKSIKAVEPAAEKAATGVKSLQSSVSGLSGPLGNLKTLFGGLLAAIGIGEIVKLGDTYQNLQSKLKIVSKSGTDLKAVNKDLLDVANRTRQPLEATINLYATLARSTKDLKPTTKDLTKATETLNKVFRVAGTDAETAKTAIVQLGQGLGAGALRGDEFNSIMEATNGVFAELISKKLGVPIGQLRDLAAQGQITGKVVFEALNATPKELEDAYRKMGETVGGALTVLKNMFLSFVGQTSEATGATNLLAQSILFIAFHLKELAVAAEIGLAAFATAKIVSFSTALYDAAKAQTLFNAVANLNPYVLIATSIIAVIALIYEYGDSIQLSAKEGDTLKAAMILAFTTIGASIVAAIASVGAWLTATLDFFTKATAAVTPYVNQFTTGVTRIKQGFIDGFTAIWSFVDGVFTKIAAGISSLTSKVTSFINLILRAIGLQSDLNSGSGSGSTAPAARDGLEMRVPGGGAVDSKLAQIRVSPGETIRVTTRQQEANRAAGLSGFRDGGTVTDGGASGGAGGAIVGLLTAMLGELRGIRAALGGSPAGSASTGSGSSSSVGSSSGGGSSVTGFGLSDLFNGGSATTSSSLTGLNDNVSPTQALLNSLLDTSGTPSLDYGNAGLFEKYMENKASLLREFLAAKDNGLNTQTKTDLGTFATLAKGYSTKDIYNQFDKLNAGKAGFTDFAALAKKSAILNQLATVFLDGATASFSGGIVSVSGTRPTKTPYASTALYGFNSVFGSGGRSDLNESNLGGSVSGQQSGYNDPFNRLQRGGVSGSSSGGTGSSAPGILDRYRDGTDFIVGGSGGVDQELVQFMATKGERVTVTPPNDPTSPVNDQAGGNARKVVHINGPLVAIYAADANSLARSKDQIAMQMKNALDKAVA